MFRYVVVVVLAQCLTNEPNNNNELVKQQLEPFCFLLFRSNRLYWN